MAAHLGTFIRSGEVHELPSEVSELSVILEDYSNSKIEVNIESEIQLNLIRNASILQARHRIAEQLTPDKNLIQSIEALDEAHNVVNLFSERLTTWHSQITGEPRATVDEILLKKNLPPQLTLLADFYNSSKILISELSEYLDKESPIAFPNLSTILGTQLSVRIMSAAGGLPKLARMPASTIQLLGAEKALFRHISDGSPPPKHGLLYQHPSVKKASKKDKGRVSRKLAAKVAIAAKVEHYGVKNE